jgi:hypothetical protein
MTLKTGIVLDISLNATGTTARMSMLPISMVSTTRMDNVPVACPIQHKTRRTKETWMQKDCPTSDNMRILTPQRQAPHAKQSELKLLRGVQRPGISKLMSRTLLVQR